MNLYKDNFDISRTTDVFIEDDRIILSEYDSKPKVFSQERVAEIKLTEIDIDKVKKAFGAKTNKELFLILKERFNTSDAFDKITHILSKHKIEFSYWSFID